MADVLRFIVLSPLFAVLVLFDIVKLPIVVCLFLPIGLIMALATNLRGEDFPMEDFLSDFFFLGIKSCLVIWKDGF